MTIEEFVRTLELGSEVSDTLVGKIKTYIDGQFVPKSRFNEVNESLKTKSNELVARDNQLKELQKSVGDNEALKTRISELQAENKKNAEAADKRFKDLQTDTAIRLALTGQVHNPDIVSGLIDKAKLVIGDDGTITAGLTEQIDSLKSTEGWLFKTEPGGSQLTNYNPKGGERVLPENPFMKDTFNLTKQGELMRRDPEMAKRLAAEAEVTI